MKTVAILSGLIFTSMAFSSVIDPTQVPPINKPVTKPIIVRKYKKVMVAVIDTGIDSALMTDNSVCEGGHKDFTGTGLHDTHGHGTHISGIIDQYAKDFLIRNDKSPSDLSKISADYCQIIIKYYDSRMPLTKTLDNTIKAFRWAIDHNVDIINYSGGGEDPSPREKKVIIEALNKGIKIVSAAGNEHHDIDKVKYYPAMYDKRIYIVGNLVNKHSRQIASTSNRGKSVNAWEVGTNTFSRLPGGFGYMSGTSQATAVKTGKLVREMLETK